MLSSSATKKLLQRTIALIQVSSFIWGMLARCELYAPIGIAVEVSFKFAAIAAL